MARRTLHLPALLGTLAAAVLMACAAALLTVSEKAEATFPGKNGRIAYTVYKGNATGGGIYTIKAFGGGKTKLIDNNAGEAGPSWGSRP